ncbi:putative Coatomer subunit gamma protein [Naja naja]|nr:putative Coatomer subunit gamma protein [Naja naja]
MIKKFDKKDEESGSGSNPFQHLEKSAILQEARIFNETPINPRRCLHILTKILYLLNQGEHFGTTEATEAFFAMTRLFQSNDWLSNPVDNSTLIVVFPQQTLRRMCYLTIKEMANISEDVIIVTSRYLHMMKVNYDVVKRWINEAQEAASSDNVMVQRAIVDCIIGIIEENPESKETGLAHLCEFIEDCEHTVLATKILHLLGKEGPRTPTPSKYIRFIFNRVVLENEAVRAGLTVSIPGMEKALHQYTLEPSEKPFDMRSVPLATAPIFEQKAEISLVANKPEKFDCTNTLNDQLLEKVTVQMEPSEAYVVLRCIPAPSLSYNQPGMCYTLVHLPLDDPTTGMFRGGLDVLVRARLALGDGVTMQVTVRSIVETPVDVILASVG